MILALDINNFIELFAFAQTSFVAESLTEVNIRFSTTDLIEVSKPNKELNSISFLNSRDYLKVSVFIGDDDPIDYYSTNKPDTFFEEVYDRLKIRDDDERFEIQFNIIKNNVNGRLSVYYTDQFITYLSSLELSELLFAINSEFHKENTLVFEPQDKKLVFSTPTIASYSGSNFQTSSSDKRTIQLNAARSLGNFNLINTYNFVPNDFYLLSCNNQILKSLFNKLCAIYSIAYLFDIATIADSNLKYKLNGYKSISGDINFKNLRERHLLEYFKIYDWVFSGGNLIDKVGLARNIISLHINQSNGINLIGNPFESIQSSYKVYEKQNIKQYIEIRNKISDQLLTFHDRANKIVENFASGFQKSALALTSFYVSAIVIKLLNKPVLKDIFTVDATVLSTVFIIFSFIYFRIARWEVVEQRQRFVTSYRNLKARYLDLLDASDIKRILNDDKEYFTDLSFIDQKQKKYSRLWQYYLLTLLISTFAMFLYNHH